MVWKPAVTSSNTLPFFIATALYWASMYVYVPILPVHAENLGASMGLVGAVVGAYGFSQLVLRIPLGAWSDRIGIRKPFIIAGLLAAAIGALGMGMSPDPVWLLAWRVMTGVGAAAWVAFTVLFSSYFPPEKATRAMAYVTFLSGASQMVSTFAGGLIAQEWGWHAPFYAAAALGLLGATAALGIAEKPLPVRRNMTPRQFYRIGTTPLLLAVSVAAMLCMWTQWAAAAGFTLVYAARLGADRAELGMLTTLMQVTYTATTLASAVMAEKVSSRFTAMVGMALLAISAFIVPMSNTLLLVGISQGLSGLGRGLAYPVLMGLSIRSVAAADRATAMGVFQAVYALGMVAGPASGGMLGDTLGLPAVFAVAGLASVAAVAVIWAGIPARIE